MWKFIEIILLLRTAVPLHKKAQLQAIFFINNAMSVVEHVSFLHFNFFAMLLHSVAIFGFS